MVQRKQRRWNMLSIAAALLAVILALSAITGVERPHVYSRDGLRRSTPFPVWRSDPVQAPAHGWSRQRDQLLTPSEQKDDQRALERAPFRVQVGVYANNTSELMLEVPSYASNGYVWLRWNEPFQRYLEDNNATASQRFMFLNELISDSDPGLQPIDDKPVKMEDGSYYQLFKYQGRYYIDQASFRRYPFMKVSLPLAIEADDVDGKLNYSRLRLLPDRQNSGMGLYAYIIGWRNHGWVIDEHIHHYATNLGFGGQEADYSQILYEISFGTSAWAAFWRLLLPLAVVMAMVLLVFKVRADDQESRASIPVTVLLTLVFLQQSYREALPDLPFLTFLDQVYVVAYVVTFLAFVLVIWIGRRYRQMEEMVEGPVRDQLQQRLQRFDDVWPLLVVVFGGVAISVCWITMPTAVSISG